MNNLIRFNPRNDMRHFQHEIDRLFSNFMPTMDTDTTGDAATWLPRVDLGETEDTYLMRLDLPGLSKDDVNISYHDGVLSISGERKHEEQTDGVNFIRLERRTGHFYRSFSLPKAIVADKIKATYKEGVLTIQVPKAEESKPRRISIS